MSRLASKSDMPSSCRYSVKKTSAFQGTLPTMPCPCGAQRLNSSQSWRNFRPSR